MLGGALEQELEAETDAEHGNARAQPLGDQGVELQLADPPHRRGERPDAREDHSLRRAGELGVCGQPCLGADAFERLLDRAQVSHAVVEDGDAGHPVRVPLVDGIPGSAGSIDTASRNARANDLKHASIMWWALEP